MKTVHTPPFPRLLPVFLCTAFLLSCNSGGKSDLPEGNTAPDFAFRDTVSARYAEGFRISYHGSYKKLEILNPYQDRTDTVTYILRPRGAGAIDTEPGARIIDIPVRSLIATSTTHVALTDILGANGVVRGMAGARYLYNRELRKGVEEGRIAALEEGALNLERVLSIGPDLVMVSAGQSSQFDDYRVLSASGIGVLINAEWLETTPLGKAEWMKVMAALLNREQEANEQFDRIEKRYLQLLEKVDSTSRNPLAITNLPFKGSWHVPAGGSFTARYLQDAGADYPWSGRAGTGGLRLAFETVYRAGLEADVWLNPGGATSLEEILMHDPRFGDFRPVRTGQVYNHYRRTHPAGGNDFWESGVVHPERVLGDLIHILHPGLLPDHKLYYYRKLE